jgi:hypothetical protein
VGIEPTRPGITATPTDLKSARATRPHALPKGLSQGPKIPGRTWLQFERFRILTRRRTEMRAGAPGVRSPSLDEALACRFLTVNLIPGGPRSRLAVSHRMDEHESARPFEAASSDADNSENSGGINERPPGQPSEGPVRKLRVGVIRSGH